MRHNDVNRIKSQARGGSGWGSRGWVKIGGMGKAVAIVGFHIYGGYSPDMGPRQWVPWNWNWPGRSNCEKVGGSKVKNKKMSPHLTSHAKDLPCEVLLNYLASHWPPKTLVPASLVHLFNMSSRPWSSFQLIRKCYIWNYFLIHTVLLSQYTSKVIDPNDTYNKNNWL